jgi:putative ABC transport system substrate-binding protein
MRRREFISLLGAAAIRPLAARAQPSRRVGLLMGGLDDTDREAQSWVVAFREELDKLGWTEGRNIEIDIRWTKADVELMKPSANELVTLHPDLIVTSSTPVTAVMLQITRTIPIVFLLVADPVGSRFVERLPRPGGNATGFTPIVPSLGGKWAELLKEVAPRVGRIALMYNPLSATFIEGYLSSFTTAAASLGVQASAAPIAYMREVESLVSASEANMGLVVIPDAFTVGQSVGDGGIRRAVRAPPDQPRLWLQRADTAFDLLCRGVDLRRRREDCVGLRVPRHGHAGGLPGAAALHRRRRGAALLCRADRASPR